MGPYTTGSARAVTSGMPGRTGACPVRACVLQTPRSEKNWFCVNRGEGPPSDFRTMTEICEQTERPVDRAVVEAWVRDHGPAVLGYLMKLCAARDRAEDCFQETFRRAVEKGGNVCPDRIRNWLYRVATNVAMDSFRQQKRQHATPVVDARSSDPTPGPEALSAQAEQVSEVRAAVAALPDRQRTILILSYYQRLSYRDIAALLDCSLGTVKTHMSRALATLAHRLRPLGE